jgi:hypothetical protein
MSTFADRVSHVVSVTDHHCRILAFLNRSRYSFFQVAPQLYSRGWVDPVRDPQILKKSGSSGNRTRTSGSVVLTTRHSSIRKRWHQLRRQAAVTRLVQFALGLRPRSLVFRRFSHWKDLFIHDLNIPIFFSVCVCVCVLFTFSTKRSRYSW